MPVTSSRQIMTGTDGCPARTSRPNVPSPRANSRFAATITRDGATRSAITPPISRKTSDGATWAAST